MIASIHAAIVFVVVVVIATVASNYDCDKQEDTTSKIHCAVPKVSDKIYNGANNALGTITV